MPTKVKNLVKVFYSYALKDEPLRDKLETHLSLLQRQELIDQWHFRKITLGAVSQNEIDEYLKKAELILLLISSDYIANDYCYGKEMMKALKRHVAGEARVVPVLLRQVDVEDAPFGNIKPLLPTDAKPVTSWTNEDEAFTNIATNIRRIVQEIQKSSLSIQKAESSTEKPAEELVVEQAKSLVQLTVPLQEAIDQYYERAGLSENRLKAEKAETVKRAFQDLLTEFARHKDWMLFLEQPLEKDVMVTGTVRDSFSLDRGYWASKDANTDLHREVDKSIQEGYPLNNTIFENTKRALLYQNGVYVDDFDIKEPDQLVRLQSQFFSYRDPAIAPFDAAVQEFKRRIPDLAHALLSIIRKEYKENQQFVTTFNAFYKLCREALDSEITTDAVDRMLVQHLLAERLFRNVFGYQDFTKRNIIAAEVDKVIQALTSRTFDSTDLLQSLDRFYEAIEKAASIGNNWARKQYFLITVYERFFHSFSAKDADRQGIVYTPQELVNFMRESVNDVLYSHFEKKSLYDREVQILDPATGTGNFIVNILRHTPDKTFEYKYTHDLFCNELMLLPYYIASFNIEHMYNERASGYQPFQGLCLVDTLRVNTGQSTFNFNEKNLERIERERSAKISVVMGNPPYNVGQKRENDNNKNRSYSLVNDRVYEFYGKSSKAKNTRALNDVFIKFFRWSTDRLQLRDGIVCFVSNNGFLKDKAFDGFRKCLPEEFTHIYHIDLGGNVRKRGGGNVFGVKVSIGITILVRKRGANSTDRKLGKIFYYKVDELLSGAEKLAFLSEAKSYNNIAWQELEPKDDNRIWLTDGLRDEFAAFLPIGTAEVKEAAIKKKTREENLEAIFKVYSRGAETTRDRWMYDFDYNKLVIKSRSMIDTYNQELAHWIKEGFNKNIDDFVTADETKIKWSSRLKECLRRKRKAVFETSAIRHALYRPFTKQFLYFDDIMTHRQGMLPDIFPKPDSENTVIWVKVGSEWPIFALVTDVIPDLLPQGGSQCFPYYIYAEDGSRSENITSWALKQFQERYGQEVSKLDIFHYVYAMLHHKQYLDYYAENLKLEMPHLPFVKDRETLDTCVRVGKQLMALHLNFETSKEYPLQWRTNSHKPKNFQVTKMRLQANNTEVLVNDWLTLTGIPPECFNYKLGVRSALEWVIDQYKIEEDRHSKIVTDPNRANGDMYIIELIGKVITVSVETVKLTNELGQTVVIDSWLE